MMRKLMFVALISVTALALGACSQRAASEQATGTAVPSPLPTSTSQTIIPTPVPVKTPTQMPTVPPASRKIPPLDVEPIRAFLASQLNLPADQITLVNWQPVEWRDACLGVHTPRVACADVITPGFALTFHAGQADYYVNTDATGKNYRLAQELPASDQLPALSWTRTGGFAGVCQNLTIYNTGAYWLRDCNAASVIAQGVLPEADRTYQNLLWERYGSFEWTSKPPPGSADMFNDQIKFYGMGTQLVAAEEQEKLNDYLAKLAGQLADSSQSTSGITGQVLIGPTCGGPIGPDTSEECADKPYQTTITVLDAAGLVVMRFTTDAEGRFNVPLQPGKYTLQPQTTGALPAAGEQEITVVSGQLLTVTITYDSGMR